jgi:hypothetical protein
VKILIATPTAGGIATTALTQSVVAATLAINEKGGSYSFCCIDGSDVVTARNILSHYFVSDITLTHILFIDNDMLIEFSVFRKLLSKESPILGAAYSERKMDMATFAAEMIEGNNEMRARALASKFNVHVFSGRFEVNDNFCKVNALGFGCMLIRREIFEGLIEKNLVSPFNSSALRHVRTEGIVYDFFDEIQLESGEWLSEDYAFCNRVLSLGDVEILAYVGCGVGHVGQFAYGGPYIERLKARKS